jgi:hypothetical protein
MVRLLLKTLSKPIANKLKQQAKESETFRSITVALAQRLHKSEMRMRLSLLGETPTKHHVSSLISSDKPIRKLGLFDLDY